MNTPQRPITRKRGRPKKTTFGVWRHPAIVERRLSTILGRRDPDDEESMTEVVYASRALARRILGPDGLDADRERHLRRLAVNAEPSEILPVLLSWRFNLPDRTIRQLHRRTDIMEMRWA
jgi:hypothetical protein